MDGSDLPPTPKGFLDPINTQAFARHLNLKTRGHDRGAQGQPSSQAETLDSVEQEIIQGVSGEWTAQYDHLTGMLRGYRDLLAHMKIGEELQAGRAEAEGARARFLEAQIAVRNELREVREALVGAQSEYEDFRERHGLTRPARRRAGHTAGLLIFCVAAESILNGFFFMEGSSRGLLGGIGTAVGISLVNILWAFALGLGPARFVHHRRVPVRILAFVLLVVGAAALLGLHLFAAHFRDAFARAGEARAYQVALETLLANPFALADIKSLYLLALGALLGFVASWKGYRHDDPYPGYGPVARRLQSAHAEFDDVHQDLLGDLTDVRDTAEKTLRGAIERITSFVGLAQQMLNGRNAIQQRFTAYESHLEDSANHLLEIYRSANQDARSDPPPAHFRIRWRLPKRAADTADVVTFGNTDALRLDEGGKAQVELGDRLEQVLRLYREIIEEADVPRPRAQGGEAGA
jgi:hypothetical protein